MLAISTFVYFQIVDPYVTVAVHDIPEEKQMFQTKVINNNGK